jgi:hypothetical protein
VPKVCQNSMFFDLLGLTSSEKHIPQVDENTVKPKWRLDALEAVTRPKQARLPSEHMLCARSAQNEPFGRA